MKETAQAFSNMMAAMADEYFAARATDIMDVGNRVLRILLGVAESPTANLKAPSIIVADDLTPSTLFYWIRVWWSVSVQLAVQPLLIRLF